MAITHRDVGKWILLKGKTRHGKNRINQHGDMWLIESVETFIIMIVIDQLVHFLLFELVLNYDPPSLCVRQSVRNVKIHSRREP